ncbi:MAG: class I SAM-dependent methyltransferase [Deltaproteobacteria bacterium]
MSDRPNLLRGLRAGRAQGESLMRRDALAGLRSSTPREDCAERLREARVAAQRDRISDREWVATTVRGILGTMDDAAIVSEAEALLAEIVARDERDFGPITEAIRAGTFTPADFSRALAERPANEHDAYAERILGVAHPPRAAMEREAEMVHFVASRVADVLDLVPHLSPDDVVYDVGAGTGKVALLTAWLSEAKVCGVELDPAYVRAAEHAREALGLDVTFVEADARALDYADLTVLYLYEPFRGAVMAEFLECIDVRRRGAPISVFSRYEVEDGLAGVPWLEWVETLPSGLRRFRSK